MRLTVWVLGREIVTIATGDAVCDDPDDDELGDALSYPVQTFGLTLPEVECEPEEAE